MDNAKTDTRLRLEDLEGLFLRKGRRRRQDGTPEGRVRIEGEIAVIPLNRNMVSIIDAGDLPLVMQFGYGWYVFRHQNRDVLYAASNLYVPSTQGNRNILMHRLIFGFPNSQIDHADGDGLNNRRGNLRLATQTQQRANSGKHKQITTSKFKGVWFCSRTERWAAEVKSNNRKYWLGRFPSEDEAARAYDAAAIRLFGEFAKLNFPNGSIPK